MCPYRRRLPQTNEPTIHQRTARAYIRCVRKCTEQIDANHVDRVLKTFRIIEQLSTREPLIPRKPHRLCGVHEFEKSVSLHVTRIIFARVREIEPNSADEKLLPQ